MLSVTRSKEWDAVSDSLVGLLAILHPNAGLGTRGVVLEVARRSTAKVLRHLRHHRYEHSLLWRALERAEPACITSCRRMAAVHGELRRLSHGLCRLLRREDAAGTRQAARTLLALFLEHSSQEERLVHHILRKLDSAATRRFADELLNRMLGDMAGRQDPPSSLESLVDLHAHYVQQLRQLQGRVEAPPSIEVHYEHSGRR